MSASPLWGLLCIRSALEGGLFWMQRGKLGLF